MFEALIDSHDDYIAKIYGVSTTRESSPGVKLDRKAKDSKRDFIGPSGFKTSQLKALENAKRMGSPSRRSEKWRYTHLNYFKNKKFTSSQLTERPDPIEVRRAAALQLMQDRKLDAVEGRVVFINGQFDLELSDAAAVKSLGLKWKCFGIEEWILEVEQFKTRQLGNEKNKASKQSFLAGLAVKTQDRVLSIQGDGENHLDRLMGATESDIFSQLNLAFLDQVRVLVVGKNCVSQEAFHFVHVSLDKSKLNSGGAASDSSKQASTGEESDRVSSFFVRQAIVLEDGAQIKLQESFVGANETSWESINTKVFLGKGAHLTYQQLQMKGQLSGYGFVLNAFIDRDSRFEFFDTSLGAEFSRVEVKVHMLEEGAHCQLSGTYIPDGKSLNDHHLDVFHQAPHTTSSLFFKGLVGGASKAVYNGRVVIDQVAQKSDSKHLNANLLLSESAEVNTKPELEIFADDVKATHGATLGSLSAEELFYLESRGLPPEAAKEILEQAFVSDVIMEGVKDLKDQSFYLAILKSSLLQRKKEKSVV